MAVSETIGQTCRLQKDGMRQVCAEFYFGSRNGDLVWNKTDEGWMLPTMKRRSMRTIEIQLRAGYNSTGFPYLLERCPFCGGALLAKMPGKEQLQLPPGNPEE